MQFSVRIISGYKFIRGVPDPPFPKKSNNHGLNTMKFSYAIGCDYHLWIWTCLISRPAFRVTWSVCFKHVTECIDREGLGRRHTRTGQELDVHYNKKIFLPFPCKLSPSSETKT